MSLYSIQSLARINRIEDIDGKLRAVSSLYWHFTGRPANCPTPDLNPEGTTDDAALRRLVSCFAAHYRIGVHQERHALR